MLQLERGVNFLIHPLVGRVVGPNDRSLSTGHRLDYGLSCTPLCVIETPQFRGNQPIVIYGDIPPYNVVSNNPLVVGCMGMV